MFRDTQEELKRLEEQLLAEEDLPKEQEQEPELDQATRVIPIPQAQEPLSDLTEEAEEAEEEEPELPQPRRKKTGRYIGRFEAYNSDKTDTDLNKYSEEVRRPKGDPVVLALSVLALILMAAILGILIWWFIRFRGFLG